MLDAGAAWAGAWPREAGTAFVSAGQTFSTGGRNLVAALADLRSFSSLYAEYGLTPDITLGAELSHARSLDAGLTAGMVFVRRPVWRTETGQIVSIEIGAGTRDDGEDLRESRLRAGLSWGLGFESRWGAGWTGVDASAEMRVPSRDMVYKADFTAGIKPNDRLMLIGQVQTGLYPGADPLIRLAPSVVRRFGKSTHIQIGVEAGVLGDDAVGLKLATWWTF